MIVKERKEGADDKRASTRISSVRQSATGSRSLRDAGGGYSGRQTLYAESGSASDQDNLGPGPHLEL